MKEGDRLINSNRLISIILLIVSAYVWFTANGFPEQIGAGPGPNFFPQLTAIILAFLAILLFFQKRASDETKDIETVPFEKGDLKRFILVFVALIILILLATYIGFFVASTLFIIVWMLLMKEKRWKFILTLSIVFSSSITLIFELLLGVQIPHGFLY